MAFCAALKHISTFEVSHTCFVYSIQNHKIYQLVRTQLY